MCFPFNAPRKRGHWAYPSYPKAPQVLPGGTLTMPPWCIYYGNTMSADPSAVINKQADISYFWALYQAGTFEISSRTINSIYWTS